MVEAASKAGTPIIVTPGGSRQATLRTLLAKSSLLSVKSTIPSRRIYKTRGRLHASGFAANLHEPRKTSTQQGSTAASSEEYRDCKSFGIAFA